MEPTAERILLLMVSFAGMLGTTFSQTGCALPNTTMINGLLESIVIGNDEGGPSANLTDFHYTCQAVGDRVGLFRSLSIAVNYMVTGDDENFYVAQIQLECNSSTGTFSSSSATLEQSVNESLVFSMATRRDCRLCTNSTDVMAVDTDANCAREQQRLY